METLKLVSMRVYLAARAIRQREEGQAMVEYALILALVSIVAFAILSNLGGTVSNIFISVNDDL